MVLSDDSALELVLGVVSIAGIFAIWKYLYAADLQRRTQCSGSMGILRNQRAEKVP